MCQQTRFSPLNTIVTHCLTTQHVNAAKLGRSTVHGYNNCQQILRLVIAYCCAWRIATHMTSKPTACVQHAKLTRALLFCSGTRVRGKQRSVSVSTACCYLHASGASAILEQCPTCLTCCTRRVRRSCASYAIASMAALATQSRMNTVLLIATPLSLSSSNSDISVLCGSDCC